MGYKWKGNEWAVESRKSANETGTQKMRAKEAHEEPKR